MGVCDCYEIHGRILFRNGAQSNQFNHMDPPTDPVELGKLKREFLDHCLKKATDEFRDMQKYVAEQGTLRLHTTGVPTPRMDAIEILKGMQSEVLSLRAQLAELAADPNTESPEQKMRKINERMEAELKQKVSSLMSEASKITI